MNPKQLLAQPYLNGAVWSTKTVDKCENCFAPQGYTTKCE